MICMIAVIRGEMDAIIGIRLLDTNTGKVINASKSKVIMAIVSGDIIIENLGIADDGKLKAIGGSLNKYTSYYNYGTANYKPSIILLSKVGAGTYECADSTGEIKRLTVREIIKGGLNVANADIVGAEIIMADNTKEIMQLTPEESEIRSKIRKYRAKCRVLGALVPRIVIEGDEVVLKEIVTNFENYQVPPFITRIDNADKLERLIKRCEKTKTIEVTNNINYIGKEAFYNIEAELIDISQAQINKMQPGLFTNCRMLKKVILPNSITNIGNSAFRGCSSLTDIDITSNVAQIENLAFSECEALRHIDMPNTLEHIGDSAFRGCNRLLQINIPNKVRYIGESAFAYCECLTEVYIPDSVNIIRDKAFSYCSSLRRVRISPNVLHINSNVFEGTIIQSIHIPEHLVQCLQDYKDKLVIY